MFDTGPSVTTGLPARMLSISAGAAAGSTPVIRGAPPQTARKYAAQAPASPPTPA